MTSDGVLLREWSESPGNVRFRCIRNESGRQGLPNLLPQRMERTENGAAAVPVRLMRKTDAMLAIKHLETDALNFFERSLKDRSYADRGAEEIPALVSSIESSMSNAG